MENLEKEKQIEEMALILKDVPPIEFLVGSRMQGKHIYSLKKFAEALYNAGYRKQSENTIELPCKLGDSVWCIYNYAKPREFKITILTMSDNHYSFFIEAKNGVYKHYCDKDAVGKWVFFSREEAEKALAKMKGGAE